MWWLQIVSVEQCWWSSNESCPCLPLMLVRRLGPTSYWWTDWLFPELLLEGYFEACQCMLLLGIGLWAGIQLMDGCTGWWLFRGEMGEGDYCRLLSWRPCTSVQGCHIVLQISDLERYELLVLVDVGGGACGWSIEDHCWWWVWWLMYCLVHPCMCLCCWLIDAGMSILYIQGASRSTYAVIVKLCWLAEAFEFLCIGSLPCGFH